MQAKAGKFRRRPLAMTSLIDVIFLLLLFFMLTSTFSKFSEVELLSAGAGNAETKGQPPPVFLRLNEDTLSLNGIPHAMDDLATALKSPDGALADQMVLVSLDDEVSSQRLVDLLAVLRAVSGIKVQVLGGK